MSHDKRESVTEQDVLRKKPDQDNVKTGMFGGESQNFAEYLSKIICHVFQKQ